MPALFSCLPASVAQVATAHGSDISSLLRNPEMAVLLGGIETVTVGDAQAAKDRMNRKTRQERKGSPVFDTLIEVLGQVSSGGSTEGHPLRLAPAAGRRTTINTQGSWSVAIYHRIAPASILPLLRTMQIIPSFSARRTHAHLFLSTSPCRVSGGCTAMSAKLLTSCSMGGTGMQRGAAMAAKAEPRCLFLLRRGAQLRWLPVPLPAAA